MATIYEADAHLGKRWQADRKVRWSRLLTADMLRSQGQITNMSRQIKWSSLSSVVSRHWEASILHLETTLPLPSSQGASGSTIQAHETCNHSCPNMSERASFYRATLLKCICSLKSNMNFIAIRIFRVHLARLLSNCILRGFWGFWDKEGGEEQSRWGSGIPLPLL